MGDRSLTHVSGKPKSVFWFYRLLAAAGILAIVFSLAASVPGRADVSYDSNLTRYPYLTDASSTTMTVNFATLEKTAGAAAVVKYGKPGTSGACSLTNTTSAILTRPFKILDDGGATSTNESQWKARLLGLSPETQYCYRVFLNFGAGDDDLLGSDPSPVFTTLPAVGVNKPFKFIVFGDWGEVDGQDVTTNAGINVHQAKLLQMMADQNAMFAVTVGDNTYNTPSKLGDPPYSIPNQSVYGDLYHTLPRQNAVFGPLFWKIPGASLPIFPSLGNHIISAVTTTNQIKDHADLMNFPQDTAITNSGGRSAIDTYPATSYGSVQSDYPSLWYAFSVGIARFYVLDAAWSNSNSAPTNGTGTIYDNDYESHWLTSSLEYTWLKADLEKSTEPIKFAFFHFPMYSDGPEGPDIHLQDSADNPDAANSLERLLTTHGVQFGFSGHSHVYERNATKNGLTTYITGGGGSDLVRIGRGAGACSAWDSYGIGWSYTTSLGYACGNAVRPTQMEQIFHFLVVTVDGSKVTITPINQLEQVFDEQIYNLDITIPVPPTNPQNVVYLPLAMR